MWSSRSISIEDPSSVGEARRVSAQLAEHLSMSAPEIGNVALAATELGTNIVKYGGRGEIVVRPLRNGVDGVELLALDRGPGMKNVGECFRDGYSTSGSPGTGLGAVRRIAQAFDVYSAPDKGTAILLHVHSAASSSREQRPAIQCGAVSVCKPGESCSGDAWIVERRGEHLLGMVVDGLGHGQYAAEAAAAAVASFKQPSGETSPARLLETAHDRLRSTRGAAAAIVDISLSNGAIRYAGVGNIGGGMFNVDRSVKDKSFASINGTLGSSVRKIQEFNYSWSARSVLILYSDGLSSHWDLSRYPGILARHPALIAGVLYRDYVRGNDDATVLVLAPSNPYGATQ